MELAYRLFGPDPSHDPWHRPSKQTEYICHDGTCECWRWQAMIAGLELDEDVHVIAGNLGRDDPGI